jgi:hypothetical protein
VWSAWAAPDRQPPPPGGARRLRRDHGRRAQKRRAIEAHESQRGLVVTDDPDGFTLPPGFAAHFVDGAETFFEAVP